MFVTFDPEDGTKPQVWDFDPDDVTRKQGEAIEKAMGTINGGPASFDAWLDLVRASNMKARGVLLWHLLKEKHPHLPIKDTPDFKRKQLKVEMSVAELRVLYKRISATKMDDAVREAFEHAFEVDIRDAMERETGVVHGEVVGTDVEETGKAS